MPITRQQLDNSIASLLVPQVDISEHILAEKAQNDYIDQEVAAVKDLAVQWSTDKGGFYTKNQINAQLTGKADLVNGLIPSNLLPSFVDDVQEYPSLAQFPALGESGKIIVAVDTSKAYRWSGSTYVALSGSDGNFIMNQGAVPQPNTNIWISGSGKMNGGLSVGGDTQLGGDVELPGLIPTITDKLNILTIDNDGKVNRVPYPEIPLALEVEDTQFGGSFTPEDPFRIITSNAIQNSAGDTQFLLNPNDSLRFEGGGGTTVAFNAMTKKITINSTLVPLPYNNDALF